MDLVQGQESLRAPKQALTAMLPLTINTRILFNQVVVNTLITKLANIRTNMAEIRDSGKIRQMVNIMPQGSSLASHKLATTTIKLAQMLVMEVDNQLMEAGNQLMEVVVSAHPNSHTNITIRRVTNQVTNSRIPYPTMQIRCMDILVATANNCRNNR